MLLRTVATSRKSCVMRLLGAMIRPYGSHEALRGSARQTIGLRAASGCGAYRSPKSVGTVLHSLRKHLRGGRQYDGASHGHPADADQSCGRVRERRGRIKLSWLEPLAGVKGAVHMLRPLPASLAREACSGSSLRRGDKLPLRGSRLTIALLEASRLGVACRNHRVVGLGSDMRIRGYGTALPSV